MDIFSNFSINNKKDVQGNHVPQSRYTNLAPLKKDTVSFTGKSAETVQKEQDEFKLPSDEDFEQLKQKIQSISDGNPDLAEQLKSVSLTKENILVADRILSDERLCNNPEFMEQAGDIIRTTGTEEIARVRISALNKILSDENLYNNPDFMNHAAVSTVMTGVMPSGMKENTGVISEGIPDGEGKSSGYAADNAGDEEIEPEPIVPEPEPTEPDPEPTIPEPTLPISMHDLFPAEPVKEVNFHKNSPQEQIETVAKLKEAGFGRLDIDVRGAKNLTPEQVDIALGIKKAGFDGYAALCGGEKNLAPEQLDIALGIKKAGFNDYPAIEGGSENLTPAQVDIAVKLKEEGFYDYYAIRGAALTPEQIDIAVKLKQAGYDDNIAIEGGKNLPAEKIDTIVKLKKAGFDDYSAMEGENLTPEQIDTAVKLKEAGFDDYFAMKRGKNLTAEQIDTAVKLKEAGFDDYIVMKGGKNLTAEQIDIAVKLKEAGFDDYSAMEGGNLTAEQIEIAVKLKEAGFNGVAAIEGGKNFPAKQIGIAVGLKEAGFDDYTAIEGGNLTPEQIDTAVKLKEAGLDNYSAIKGGVNFPRKETDNADLKTGDIVQLENSNHIGIKLSDGSTQELDISPVTYCKLFPDGCDLKVSQQQIGDCYLVSSIYSLMKNPNTRAIVLECFTENADGSITVKLPKGNVEFTLDPGKNMSDYVDKTKIMSGSEGAAMLEYTYGLELVDKQNKKLSQKQRSLIGRIADEVKINKLTDKTNDLVRDKSAEELRGNGGWMGSVCSMFGLKTGSCDPNSYEARKLLLLNADNCSKYVFTGSTNRNEHIHRILERMGFIDRKFEFLNESLDIVRNHAYAITPRQTSNDEIEIEVTNPKHTDQHTTLTYDEFIKYFSHLSYAKVE